MTELCGGPLDGAKVDMAPVETVKILGWRAPFTDPVSGHRAFSWEPTAKRDKAEIECLFEKRRGRMQCVQYSILKAW